MHIMDISLLLVLLFFQQTIQESFHLDPPKFNKLQELLVSKNLTLEFEIRQRSLTHFDLITINQENDVLFSIGTTTLTSPNRILIEYNIRDGLNKLVKIASPFSFGNDQFHRILMILSGKRLSVLMNCHLLHSADDDELIFGPQLLNASKITLGSGIDRNGTMQMRAFSSDIARPMKSLCPHIEVLNNKNNEFEYRFPISLPEASTKQQNLEEQIALIGQRINNWDKLLSRIEARVSRVELHQRGCKIDGNWYSPGLRVHDLNSCRECQCDLSGKLHCGQIGCPRLDCAHPISPNGKCCPECGKRCFYNGRNYESGESFWPKSCVYCHCNNGIMNCEFRNVSHCQILGCAEQDLLPNQCCPVCVNIDHCANTKCDDNAFCVSRRHSALCQCKPGFFGNGTKCFDIDECLWNEDTRIQLGGCGEGTICINLPGSFKCECLPGFQKLNERNCLDLIRV